MVNRPPIVTLQIAGVAASVVRMADSSTAVAKRHAHNRTAICWTVGGEQRRIVERQPNENLLTDKLTIKSGLLFCQSFLPFNQICTQPDSRRHNNRHTQPLRSLSQCRGFHG